MFDAEYLRNGMKSRRSYTAQGVTSNDLETRVILSLRNGMRSRRSYTAQGVTSNDLETRVILFNDMTRNVAQSLCDS